MRRTVINLLKQAIEKYPDSTYLCEKTEKGWTPSTYQQVDELSDGIASGLLRYNFNQYDKIAILSEGRTDWVVSEYGIIKAGCIAVPLSIKLLPEEILFRLEHSEAKAIFVSKNTLGNIIPVISRIKQKNFKIFCYDDISSIIESNNKDVEIIHYKDIRIQGETCFSEHKEQIKKITENIREHDTVTISYTSGTSGNPKGIMLSHLNYHSNSVNAWQYFELPEHLKTLIILPLDHSFAHTVGLFISCVCALAIYFVDGRGGPVNTLKNIPVNLKEVKPDFLLTVPALTGNFMNKIKDGIAAKGGFVEGLFNAGLKAGNKMYRDGFQKAPFLKRLFYSIPHTLANKLVYKKVREIFGGNLKYCIGGGALLDIKQQQFFYALGVPVYQGYGLTEAAPIISTNTNKIHKLGTSGHVIYGIECIIMEQDGNVLPKGQKGEIVIRGNNVMEGYFKNETATAETIKDGWLHTGDMGYIDEDDFLMVVGREKALLISQDGEKYSPEGIEEAIVNCSELVSQVMIYNDHNKFTTALVTLDQAKIIAYKEKHELHDTKALLEAIHNSFYQFMKDEEYAGQFPSKWIPTNFRILKESFNEENQMINSTLKMVRPKITERYQHLLDEIYENTSANQLTEHNINIIKEIILDKDKSS
jgi:long-chain acyl-CoA synthetase